MLTLMLLGS